MATIASRSRSSTTSSLPCTTTAPSSSSTPTQRNGCRLMMVRSRMGSRAIIAAASMTGFTRGRESLNTSIATRYDPSYENKGCTAALCFFRLADNVISSSPTNRRLRVPPRSRKHLRRPRKTPPFTLLVSLTMRPSPKSTSSFPKRRASSPRKSTAALPVLSSTTMRMESSRATRWSSSSSR